MTSGLLLLVALAAAPNPNRLEWGGVPAINYDSDLGFGFGAIGNVAKLSPNHVPYAWRLQLQLYAAAKESETGDLEIPFQAHYLQFDFPGFVSPALRVNGEAAFRRFSNAGWYGLGSAAEERADAPPKFYRYDRIFPSLLVNGRYALVDTPVEVGKRRLELLVGTRITYNLTRPYDGSLLARDIVDPELEPHLHGFDDHVLVQLHTGLLWDTRDDEFAPTQGTFTELSARFAKAAGDDAQHAAVYLGSSWFAALWKERLVAAARAEVDLIVGDPPFYELSGIGALARRDAPGGGRSLRGILLQRFHGKLKTLLNLELRSQLLTYHLGEVRHRVGLVFFADVGRVWSDWSDVVVDGEPLDTPFSAFELGTGAGLRYHWGETFVIRADYGYSPTQGTSGLYINVGQFF